MQRLLTLALSLLLGNSALADNSTVNDELQQWITERNVVIGVNLESKIDALLDNRLRKDARFRDSDFIAQGQEIAGNLLVAAR